jgi:hypothetical protein
MSPDSPPTLPTAPLGKSAIAGAVLLFIAGFAVTASLMHLLAGNPLGLYAAERSEKLEILRRNGYPYNSAMFGSSHVHQGFDPRAFDAILAGSPFTTHSFNLGIDGGSVMEERVMALGFLDHLKPASASEPCFVMLETDAPQAFAMMFTSHPRQINILDWESLRVVLQLPPDGYERPNQIHHRLTTFTAAFYHAIAMGMLSDRIFRPPFREASIQAETADDRRGLHHVADKYGEADIEHALSRQHVPPTPVAAQLSRGNATIMEDIRSSPNGKRVQLAWVVMPLLRDLELYDVYAPSEPTSFGDVPVFDMARPDLYPQLYDRSLWADSQHMNAQGSQLFSRLLAQQLLIWSRAHPVHGCGG